MSKAKLASCKKRFVSSSEVSVHPNHVLDITHNNSSTPQSGQSLIEHSYKAHSDLSAAGWEYVKRLKDIVIERGAKSLEQRGLNPQDRRLVVCLVLFVLL
jgi:hypothetical protein